MIDLERVRNNGLESEPFQWAAIDDLFSPDDAAELAATYPCDHFKLVSGYGGEKDYEYEARSLIRMGASEISYPEGLSEAWRTLGTDLLSAEYRAAMSALTGRDLTRTLLEVNVFHYGPGCSLGAHKDLPEKLVTHVLYFNRTWNRADGGCLSILRSGDSADVAAEILPIVGHSCVIVRSESSWHAVSRVVNNAASSRRSITVTFYPPGAVSSMWPPGDSAPLRDYQKTRR
ncbi:MAG: 2OG-Fe(II) oxygenase [Acidobacteria bacterium]|nr:2OG-Fe(II) oxygenase [Acidobacteriota bacterium]